VRSPSRKKRKSQSLTLIVVEDSKGSNIHKKTTIKTPQAPRSSTKMTQFPSKSLLRNLSLKIPLKRIIQRRPIPKGVLKRKRPSRTKKREKRLDLTLI